MPLFSTATRTPKIVSIGVGAIAGGYRVLLVVHCYPNPDDPDLIRVIGLRQATTREKRCATKMASDRKLTDNQMRQLRALQDREPDTRDIPEASAGNWQHAQHGAFSKARKGAISLRVDMDVLDWLRQQGPGYQDTINRILRERMQAERR